VEYFLLNRRFLFWIAIKLFSSMLYGGIYPFDLLIYNVPQNIN